MLTEISTECEGVLWMGEDECRVVVLHGKMSGILFWESALENLTEEGQKKWMKDRVTTVVLAGMRMMSGYQPIWGMDEEGMIEYISALETQIAMTWRD